MKFCFGFFILLWLFVGVAKTLQPESKTTNTKNNKCSSNSNDTSLEEARECEYKKAEHIRRKIEKKYRWLPRSNFYRQLYILRDSTRKMIYCNNGTIYSDQTSPPDIQVDHFLRYDYYGYKADKHFDDECYATVVYTEKNMDANSKFIVHFSAKKSTEGSNDAKEAWIEKWGYSNNTMAKKFSCHPYTYQGLEPCNTIEWVIGLKLKLQVSNRNSRGRGNSKGVHYTAFNGNKMFIRRFLWNLVYPDWPDIDDELYRKILQLKNPFPNISQTIQTSDEVFTIPNRLLLSEDTIDEKLGNIGTIAVICIVCLYVIMFRIAYQWIIKGNQMEEAHNIA